MESAVEDIYFKIGAIREVFEETNILIATNNPEQKAEKLLQWRPEVQVRKVVYTSYNIRKTAISSLRCV